MGTTMHLQNRMVPGGSGRIVIAWPTDEPEAFCMSDDAFTDAAHRVIVHGTDRCALHGMYDEPCLTGYRQPAECPHERLDPAAGPATPRCLICGRRGTDVTARHSRGSFAALPGPAPDEVWGDDTVLLGPPAEPEAS
jgi:hypothetical protein